MKVLLGTVLRAHGVRGLVRVRATGDSLAALLAHKGTLTVGGRVYELVQATPERGDWLVKLRGVDDRDQADALRGQAVEAARADLPPPAEGEVYVADLVGCEVVDTAGAVLGRVRATWPGGAQELLAVEQPGGGEFLLPFVEPLVVSVDVAARRLVCDPPEGLIDLARAERDTPEGDVG